MDEYRTKSKAEDEDLLDDDNLSEDEQLIGLFRGRRLPNYRIAWDHNAKGENVQQKFRNYDSVDDFIQDKMNLLSKRYKVDFSKDNESSYFDKIIKGGYAEDPYYRSRLNDMYKSVLGRWS